jgi:hypothetical protein
LDAGICFWAPSPSATIYVPIGHAIAVRLALRAAVKVTIIIAFLGRGIFSSRQVALPVSVHGGFSSIVVIAYNAGYARALPAITRIRFFYACPVATFLSFWAFVVADHALRLRIRIARLILTPPVDHPRTWAVLLRVDVLPDLAQVAADIAGGSLTLELLGRGALAFQLLFAGFAVTAATTAAFATASH